MKFQSFASSSNEFYDVFIIGRKILFFSIFLSFIGVGECLVTTMYPITDSFLDSGNPTTNYGTSSSGYVYRDVWGSNAYFDLVCMFNISILPSTVTNVEVIYQQKYISLDEILFPIIAFNVYEVSTNWTETGTTWNNPPVTLRTTDTNYLDYDSSKLIVPAKTVYQDAKSVSRDLIAFRINSGYTAVEVYMRESWISDRPFIRVTY